MARFCSPFSVFAFLAIAIVLTFSTVTHAQHSPPLIEVKNEDDVRDLRALDLEGKRLIQEQNSCKKTAKDYKQECLCDKYKEYIDFHEKTFQLTADSSRISWIDAILSYEDGGQVKRTSLKRLSQINLDFDMSCLRNEDGSYRANHEWDKPELIIKKAEDVKDLRNLHKFSKKVGMAVIDCHRHGHKYDDCNCAQKENRQLIFRRTVQLDKKHPDWKDHVLVYDDDGYTVKSSWAQTIREAKQKSLMCEK